MKQGLKVKWLSLMVTLFLAFGTVFSVATAALPEAKAYDADVTVSVQEIVVPAGQTSTFTVYADAKQGFSSYESQFEIPYFIRVLEIESRIDAYNGYFEYNGNHVTFSSTQLQNGYVALFTVTFTTDTSADGETGDLHFYGSIFTDVYGNKLQVAEQGTSIVVMGEYVRQKGDFDGDGNVNIQDVMYMQRYIVGNYNRAVSDADFYAGDINGDKEINIVDCQLVQSYIIGIIGPLEDYGGGGNPHGEENICGTYTHYFDQGEGTGYTVTLDLYENRRFTEDFGNDGSRREGTYVNADNRVYLVDGYTLETVYVYPDERIFDTSGYVYFNEELATVEGYQDTYRVNGSTEDTVTEDTVTVAENGAFYRTCEEDGYQIQYNGMIQILKAYEDKADGIAYVFGTNESDCWQAMPFTMDKNNKVIYVQDNGNDKEEYEINFVVIDSVLDNREDYYMTFPAGTSYYTAYQSFIKTYGEELAKKFKNLNLDNPYAESEIDVFDTSEVINSYDEIRFYTDVDESRVFYEVETFVYKNKDGYKYEANSYIKLYYGCTASDIANAMEGKDAYVVKQYRDSENGYRSIGAREKIKLSASMLGDVSGINFSNYSSSYEEIPVNVTYGGKSVAATLRIQLVPDLSRARVVKTCVAPESRYSTSYVFMRIFDNGWLEYCSFNRKDEGEDIDWYYIQYVTEEYNGTTVYVINKGYVDEVWAMNGEKYEGYDVLSYLLPLADDTVTTYTGNMFGENVKFCVFGGCYANMYVLYGENEEFNGTCKVRVEEGKFYYETPYYQLVYDIDENNNLVPSTTEDEPYLMTIDFQGIEFRLYADGKLKAYMGSMCVGDDSSWTIKDEDYSVIYIDMSVFEQGAPTEMPFYKWNIDGKYRVLTEPDWESMESAELNYVKDGETLVYTIYEASSSTKYLYDGNSLIETSSYTKGLLRYYVYDYNTMTRGEVWYYYNTENKVIYDVVRYQAVDKSGNSFGYIYINESLGFAYGDWDNRCGIDINNGVFIVTVNPDRTYSVSYNSDWLFTATQKMATSMEGENQLVVSDYAVKPANDGEVIGEGAYKLNVYNVFNGEIMGPTELNVNSYKEFENRIYQTLSEHPDAPTLCGVFYDIDGKKPVTDENFHSGDIYLIFVQNGENGNGSGEIYGIDLYVIVNGDMNTEPYKISVQSYEEFAGNLKNYSETGYIVEGAFFDEFRKEMVTSDNFRSGNVYLFMTQRG